MVVVAGCDLSTKKITVVVLGHDEPHIVELGVEYRTKTITKNDILGRFTELTDQFGERLEQDYIWATVEHWYIESMGFVRGGRASLDMAYLWGGVMSLLGRVSRTYTLVHPMVWKAQFGIAGARGKRAKELSVEKAHDELGIEVPNDDVADAVLVALYGRSVLLGG